MSMLKLYSCLTVKNKFSQEIIKNDIRSHIMFCNGYKFTLIVQGIRVCWLRGAEVQGAVCILLFYAGQATQGVCTPELD